MLEEKERAKKSNRQWSVFLLLSTKHGDMSSAQNDYCHNPFSLYLGTKLAHRTYKYLFTQVVFFSAPFLYSQ
jgi:hypothetical protein